MRAIERRAYLRIEDTVHVSLQSVSEAALKNTLPETILGLPKTFSIQRELYQLELDAREINREIAADDRKLGSFTHNLNRRIELLGAVVTATFIMDNKDSSDTVMKVLDISAAGLSFVSSDLLRANSPIALKIVFSDVNLGIACYARVRYALLGKEDTYRIGVQFTPANDTTEALLNRYIASLQAKARRDRLHNIR